MIPQQIGCQAPLFVLSAPGTCVPHTPTVTRGRGLFAFGTRVSRANIATRGKTLDLATFSLIFNDLRIGWNRQPICELQRCFRGRPDRDVAGVTTNAGPRTHPPAR